MVGSKKSMPKINLKYLEEWMGVKSPCMQIPQKKYLKNRLERKNGGEKATRKINLEHLEGCTGIKNPCI